MEKINIAEILENFPKGTKLYSPIFGDVYLDKIRPHLAIVVTMYKEREDVKEEFLYDGRYGLKGECMLFPSKDQRDWNKFQRPFKDGDIIISDYGDIHICRDLSSSYCCLRGNTLDKTTTTNVKFNRLATEEEKQKLFAAIKANGYKWNAETKTLERLIAPKFNKGDKVRVKRGVSESRIIDGVFDTFYSLIPIGKIDFTDQHNWELVPNKFDVTTLKPFDKVLIRDNNRHEWCISLFSHYNDEFRKYKYSCINGFRYSQCIPYDSNKKLLSTINDCDEYYKTWE